MLFRSFRIAAFSASALAAAVFVSSVLAQEPVHGRKYKPAPPTAHITVTVHKGFNDKPMMNAAVIFHATKDGRNDGNLEVKTDEDGKATIDVIEIGSRVNVQVIANGFATAAQDLDVDGPSKELTIKLLRPRAQISNYTDNDGKAAEGKPGVQEPPHPAPIPKRPTAPPATPQ